MASYESARAITVEAGTAILPYRFIVQAADGQVDHAGTVQIPVDGISGEDQPDVGKDLPMIVPDGGLAKVEAATALDVGDFVATDDAGKAIEWVDAAGNACLGKVWRDAPGADGDITTIQFVLKQTGAGS